MIPKEFQGFSRSSKESQGVPKSPKVSQGVQSSPKESLGVLSSPKESLEVPRKHWEFLRLLEISCRAFSDILMVPWSTKEPLPSRSPLDALRVSKVIWCLQKFLVDPFDILRGSGSQWKSVWVSWCPSMLLGVPESCKESQESLEVSNSP